jgi:hypothetical protein
VATSCADVLLGSRLLPPPAGGPLLVLLLLAGAGASVKVMGTVSGWWSTRGSRMQSWQGKASLHLEMELPARAVCQ